MSVTTLYKRIVSVSLAEQVLGSIIIIIGYYYLLEITV